MAASEATSVSVTGLGVVLPAEHTAKSLAWQVVAPAELVTASAVAVVAVLGGALEALRVEEMAVKVLRKAALVGAVAVISEGTRLAAIPTASKKTTFRALFLRRLRRGPCGGGTRVPLLGLARVANLRASSRSGR